MKNINLVLILAIASISISCAQTSKTRSLSYSRNKTKTSISSTKITQTENDQIYIFESDFCADKNEKVIALLNSNFPNAKWGIHSTTTLEKSEGDSYSYRVSYESKWLKIRIDKNVASEEELIKIKEFAESIKSLVNS
ncbi:hypothetical protein [Aureibacter tunicatorum]|uniref:Uncharacterized protein n=1 Tax=Aureibacter tunicatorum TaxID=866807 RepID=A0AAE4BTA2_9BACT|nr:hypothetical protein [Aureibacter tunicatorum]MDR6240581.1 hypothetical protein [Aureibacter tunicatorum]BDD06558.1 hypothetical protein AUTU_40410 [Aureibacter tunicatorum]